MYNWFCGDNTTLHYNLKRKQIVSYKNRKEADYFQESKVEKRAQKAVKHFIQESQSKLEARMSRRGVDLEDDDLSEYTHLIR